MPHELQGTSINMLTGMLANYLSRPPSEGLLYHARAGQWLDWNRTSSGGSGGPGMAYMRFAANTTEYSIRIHSEHEAGLPMPVGEEDRSPSNISAELKFDVTWRGEVW